MDTFEGSSEDPRMPHVVFTRSSPEVQWIEMLSHVLFHFLLTPLSCCQTPQNDMTNDSATGLKRNEVFIIYNSRIRSQAVTCHIIACCSYMRLLIWNASNKREILMINEQVLWLSPLHSTLHSRMIPRAPITLQAHVFDVTVRIFNSH
jgi:hypothetical protein